MQKYSSRKAEEMRLRSLYREAAMRGRIKGLTLGALKSLVGPDCAYHLYGSLKPARPDSPGPKSGRKVPSG